MQGKLKGREESGVRKQKQGAANQNLHTQRQHESRDFIISALIGDFRTSGPPVASFCSAISFPDDYTIFMHLMVVNLL